MRERFGGEETGEVPRLGKVSFPQFFLAFISLQNQLENPSKKAQLNTKMRERFGGEETGEVP